MVTITTAAPQVKPTMEELGAADGEERRDMWAVQRLAHTIQSEASVPLTRAQDLAMDCYLADVEGFRQDTRSTMEAEAAEKLEGATALAQQEIEAQAQQGEVVQSNDVSVVVVVVV